MRLLLAGGDARFAWAARLAASRGLEAAVWPGGSDFPALRAEEGFIREADVVVMANPWRAALPGPPDAAAILGRMKPGAALILPDDLGAPSDAPAHLCLSEDEDYLRANANLTAEGAVCAAMGALPCAIRDTRALVIGYGRIGRRTARLLTAMGASVTVAARRESARQAAEAAGAAACSLEEMADRLGRWRLIISTPPATVLPDALLREIDPEAQLMDLASPPYGFSLERARALGLKAARENGLPGRYCPESAGRLLLDAALKAIKKGEKGNE